MVVPVLNRDDNVCGEISNVAAQVIVGGYTAHAKAATVEVDKDWQALSSWLCIGRLVDAYRDLVAIWSWNGLVCDAVHWDRRLAIPALFHIPPSDACHIHVALTTVICPVNFVTCLTDLNTLHNWSVSIDIPQQ